ncbi:solute carrier family 2 member 11, like [Brachyhypopomus gauderio]|uniref:solute carrier family 2 member 11, like n=1 Tax=Brachyhypopomus gauderio TaxID=698409 RepID=UPI0040428FBE
MHHSCTVVYREARTAFGSEQQPTETMTPALQSLLESPVLAAVMVITGIGGTFQYGFHISVLTSPSVYVKALVNSTCARRYGRALEAWELSLLWSFIVSTYSIGGLLSSQYAGRLATIYGRKRCLVLNNLVAICAAVLMGFSKTAASFEMILAARFLYGINAGLGLAVHTMYILECAPKRLRGMVGVSVGCFVSMGKFFGQLLGISEIFGTEDKWPVLLAFSGLIGLLQLVSLPFLPESPRYLLLVRGDSSGCEKALRQILGAHGDLTVEVEEMQAEHAAQQGVKNHSLMELMLSRAVRWQLVTIIITFVTLQLCGINAVYLYSSDVFRAAGIPEHHLRYVALGTGLCEVSTSMGCGMVIERTGKRQLLILGYLGMAAILAILTVTLYLQVYVSWMPYCSTVLIFIYIFFFSSGPAAVTAPLPGEIFSQSFKAAAFTVACTLNWVGLFLVGMVFPLIVEHLGYFCFLIFFVFCLGSGVFVWYHVPETRNKSILEITAAFERMHSKDELSMGTKLRGLQATPSLSGLGTKL